MTKTIILPQAFRLNAIDRFAAEVVAPDGKPSDSSYVLDFSRLDFIDGSGYTVLSNTIEWLRYHGASVYFKNVIELQREGIRYLDGCGFFERYLGKKIIRDSRCKNTTLPCTPVEFAKVFSWIEHELSPWLSYALNTSHASLSGVRTCVKELFNNISDHAAVHTGFVHAQHYPNIREVKITVSDFGVGIPTTIRRRFGKMTDSEAIRMSAEEGITSQSRPNNMGAGLNFLIDCVTGNDGSVLIHSLSGSLKCFRDKGRQRRQTANWRSSYPGTLVDIALDTRLFVGDDDERGEVEW